MANRVDLGEMAHYEPPHQDLRCLQIQLFSSLVLKELSTFTAPTRFKVPFLLFVPMISDQAVYKRMPQTSQELSREGSDQPERNSGYCFQKESESSLVEIRSKQLPRISR